ncbi:hypothetical protein MDAP_000916 [Mitosporidium daphniae]
MHSFIFLAAFLLLAHIAFVRCQTCSTILLLNINGINEYQQYFEEYKSMLDDLLEDKKNVDAFSQQEKYALQNAIDEAEKHLASDPIKALDEILILYVQAIVQVKAQKKPVRTLGLNPTPASSVYISPKQISNFTLNIETVFRTHFETTQAFERTLKYFEKGSIFEKLLKIPPVYSGNIPLSSFNQISLLRSLFLHLLSLSETYTKTTVQGNRIHSDSMLSVSMILLEKLYESFKIISQKFDAEVAALEDQIYSCFAEIGQKWDHKFSGFMEFCTRKYAKHFELSELERFCVAKYPKDLQTADLKTEEVIKMGQLLNKSLDFRSKISINQLEDTAKDFSLHLNLHKILFIEWMNAFKADFLKIHAIALRINSTAEIIDYFINQIFTDDVKKLKVDLDMFSYPWEDYISAAKNFDQSRNLTSTKRYASILSSQMENIKLSADSLAKRVQQTLQKIGKGNIFPKKEKKLFNRLSAFLKKVNSNPQLLYSTDVQNISNLFKDFKHLEDYLANLDLRKCHIYEDEIAEMVAYYQILLEDKKTLFMYAHNQTFVPLLKEMEDQNKEAAAANITALELKSLNLYFDLKDADISEIIRFFSGLPQKIIKVGSKIIECKRVLPVKEIQAFSDDFTELNATHIGSYLSAIDARYDLLLSAQTKLRQVYSQIYSLSIRLANISDDYQKEALKDDPLILELIKDPKKFQRNIASSLEQASGLLEKFKENNDCTITDSVIPNPSLSQTGKVVVNYIIKDLLFDPNFRPKKIVYVASLVRPGESIDKESIAPIRLISMTEIDREKLMREVTGDFLIKQFVKSEEKIAFVERAFSIQHQLVHENIVRAYQQDGDQIFMEYVQGCDLSLIPQDWTKNAAILGYIFKKAAQGLKLIHENDIAHGDLKPHNILVSRQGDVKIVDFDFAVEIKRVNSKDIGATKEHPSGKPPYSKEEYRFSYTWPYCSPEFIDLLSVVPKGIEDILVSKKNITSEWAALTLEDLRFTLKNNTFPTKESDVFCFAAAFIDIFSNEESLRYDRNYLAFKKNGNESEEKRKNYQDVLNLIKSFDAKFADTINMALDPCPEKRPTISDVLECLENSPCCTETEFKGLASNLKKDDPISFLKNRNKLHA